MSSPAALAVVVPSAGGSPHLTALVASLDEDTALFVVSEETTGPGVRVPTQDDSGFAQRANLGLAAAKDAGHQTAVLCNDDLVFLPGALRRMRTAIHAPHESVGIVAPLVLDWDSDLVQQAGISVSLLSGRTRELRRVPSEVQAFSGAAMALNLRCWEELGGFDERFEFYFEDIEFCLRASAAGWALSLVEDARVRHRGGGTRSRSSPEAAWHLGRSHALFCCSLPGGRLARQRRLLWSGAAGLGWSLRASGLHGARNFARGWRTGLQASRGLSAGAGVQ